MTERYSKNYSNQTVRHLAATKAGAIALFASPSNANASNELMEENVMRDKSRSAHWTFLLSFVNQAIRIYLVIVFIVCFFGVIHAFDSVFRYAIVEQIE